MCNKVISVVTVITAKLSSSSGVRSSSPVPDLVVVGGLALCRRDDGVVDRVVVVEGGGGLRVVRRRPLGSLPLLVL